jgi:DNA invertase Pin-like site-specific DNA recombinase
LRVLAVKRISKDTEQSSALERQDVRLSEAIRTGNHTLAGWVEDATVSGAVNLDKRPSLAKWLQLPLLHEWDAMMVTAQDRITRDDLHWAAFVGWVLENNKTVIVLDDPSFDLSTPNGRMIAGIKAAQAANYRNDVIKKRLDQLAWFREEQLWPGGSWPFGFRAVRVAHNGKQRWRLVPDPVTAPLVREAFDRLVNQADTMGSIAKDWNTRGIRTARDHQRHVNGLEGRENASATPLDTKWRTNSIRSVLTNPVLMGYATHKGEIQKKHGLPVQWTDPILTREEFDQLQEVITQRGAPMRGVDNRATDLAGIFYCRCSRVMHANRSTKKRRDFVRHYAWYLCRSAHDGDKCQYATSWRRDDLHIHLEEMLLTIAGDLEITTKTFVPGTDRTSDIDELRQALENLTGNLVHLKPGSAAATAVLKAMQEHEEALTELEALPVVPSRWEETGTGETFREFWDNNPDWKTRAEFLRKTGIRMYVGGSPKAPDLELLLPADLQRRINDAFSNSIEPGYLQAAVQWTGEAVAEQRAAEAAMQEEAIKIRKGRQPRSEP